MSEAPQFVILASLLVGIAGGVLTMAVYVVRVAARWGRTEQCIEDLVDRVDKLVSDKDAVHREIVTTMREDRAVTDKRLRWLEETLWTTLGRERGASRGRPT